MSNLRDPVASAFYASNLKNEDYKEMPVDRIGALASADRLGSLLWRLKYANDKDAFKPAALLLAKKMEEIADKQKWTRAQKSLIQKLCAQAIIEWINDICLKCKGRGRLAVERYRKTKKGDISFDRTCPDCNGTAKRRWRDSERARAIGAKKQNYNIYWERKLFEATKIITDYDLSTNRELMKQLEHEIKN